MQIILHSLIREPPYILIRDKLISKETMSLEGIGWIIVRGKRDEGIKEA